MRKTNPQVQANREIAKALFAIADALKNRGATLPALQPTPPMANPLDGAILEVAKGVHQVAQGVKSLPTSPTTSASVSQNDSGDFVYRLEERIVFTLVTPDYFEQRDGLHFQSSLDGKHQSFPYKIYVTGEGAEAVYPQQKMFNEKGKEINSSGKIINQTYFFYLTRYVPEVTFVLEMVIPTQPQRIEQSLHIEIAENVGNDGSLDE